MSRDLDLLFVYDATYEDWTPYSKIVERKDADLSVGLKGGGFALSQELNKIIDKGITFKRALFTCHGRPGILQLSDGEHLGSNRLRIYFENKGYDKLFPYPARIYFNGCNVGVGDLGQEFLETAGRIFLKRSGGVVFAMNDAGLYMDYTNVGALTVFMYGHVFHLDSRVTKVHIYPGGIVVPEIHTPPPSVWGPEPANHRDNVGNKI